MSKLSPEKHMNKIMGKAYNLLRIIRVTFEYLDENIFKKLIMGMA